ncbi:kynureninase [Erythrobacteraceae bacterium CFH 75059]|uniref:kynureninase n=1 Tax=Qipengyuania thermophila TaxID=2509361 RepID=UPI001021C344|nr:kynureninase [Qipengyuania thermophila]TCD06868.1 kynureninase [Erythrobacteraceae bacterium CFH 75059]
MIPLGDEARALDAADPLAAARALFTLPEGVIYLDGNSLGALPAATPERLRQVVERQWGEQLIRSWNAAPGDTGGWIDLPRRVGAKIAPLIGAHPDEVIACDSTSVNLFKLIAAALALRPGRRVVLSEPGSFPTDLYMIAGLEAQGLAERRLVPPGALADAVAAPDVALLLLSHVHYRTGAMHDMAALTRAAHNAGALVLWDLSHSCGAVELALNGCEADFAVGCGYKYLNGGPGAPAFAFVARRHQDRLVQPLTGWFGHARPFAFEDDYAPAEGVARLLAGTPPVLGLAALEVGVDTIASLGMAALATKSRALSQFFLRCLAATEASLRCVSPANPHARGSQLSFAHPDAYAVCQALIARGVIGDFREPDVLRLGFAPAYLAFSDVAAAAGHLADVLRSGSWREPRFARRAAVT